MKVSEPPVIVEQDLPVSAEELWKWLTERDKMVQWFFDNIPEFRPEPGFKTEFSVSTGEREFPHLWEVREAIPNRKLTLDWRYRNYPGRGLVTFEILPADLGCRLKLTNTVLEDFPDEIPEFRRESCVGGWEYFLKQRLPAVLNR